jgi:uncharacterized integral membrane protein
MRQSNEPVRNDPPAGGATGGSDGAVTPTRPTPSGLSRSRVGGAWVGLILGALLLVLLLIFVLQNGQTAQVSFFGAEVEPPLGVALLLAAVAGGLIVAVLGTVRIVQLRRAAHAARKSVLERGGSTESGQP